MSRPPGPPPPPPRRDTSHLRVVPTPTEPREIKDTANFPADAVCQCICRLWLHQGICTGVADLAISPEPPYTSHIYMCQACEDDIVRQTA